MDGGTSLRRETFLCTSGTAGDGMNVRIFWGLLTTEMLGMPLEPCPLKVVTQKGQKKERLGTKSQARGSKCL